MQRLLFSTEEEFLKHVKVPRLLIARQQFNSEILASAPRLYDKAVGAYLPMADSFGEMESFRTELQHWEKKWKLYCNEEMQTKEIKQRAI